MHMHIAVGLGSLQLQFSIQNPTFNVNAVWIYFANLTGNKKNFPFHNGAPAQPLLRLPGLCVQAGNLVV